MRAQRLAAVEREEWEELAVAVQFSPCRVVKEKTEDIIILRIRVGAVDRFGEGIMVPAMVVTVVGPTRQVMVDVRGLSSFIIDDLAQE